MKIDPYNSKERYLKWKKETEAGIPGISKLDSDLIKHYFNDMENGLNISTIKKGSRSYIRLNALRARVLFLAKEFERRFKLNEFSRKRAEPLRLVFLIEKSKWLTLWYAETKKLEKAKKGRKKRR